MKRFLIILFILLGLPVFAENVMHAQRGVVTQIQYVDVNNQSSANQFKQQVEVKILSGKFKGQKILVDNMITGNPAYDILLSKRDKVILHLEPKSDFVDGVDDVDFFISDIERTGAVYFLTGLFFFLLMLIGRKKGIYSFLSILATAGLIFFALTPMILNGIPPVIASLIVCILSTVITVYLVGGINRKSSSAVCGTVLSLIFAACLSLLTIHLASLTGFAGEESMFLYSARQDLDFTGILSASIMLAALGAIMDVGVSIASTINEIHETDNKLGIKELFTSGMNVGRDIIGTMSNTLILVYLGSALPLVLLSDNIDLYKFFNLNQVVTEMSSALVGSIAILVCVPLTAIISSYLIKKRFDV